MRQVHRQELNRNEANDRPQNTQQVIDRSAAYDAAMRSHGAAHPVLPTAAGTRVPLNRGEEAARGYSYPCIPSPCTSSPRTPSPCCPTAQTASYVASSTFGARPAQDARSAILPGAQHATHAQPVVVPGGRVPPHQPYQPPRF